MPPVSQRQRAAMFAAKAGKSTLGIPQDVGADFTTSDPGGPLPDSAPGPKPAPKAPKGRGATNPTQAPKGLQQMVNSRSRKRSPIG